MFLSQQLPRIHLISQFTCPYPKRVLLITSALASKPVPTSISHFAPTIATPQEHTPLSLETLFVPPDTDVSSLENSSLGARILKGSNIVLSKYAAGGGAEIVNAEFVKSSVSTEDCPSDGMPEFALVGRSNVGKSSLLNSLVRRKRLALTSKKPGKTQCINHFRINDSWYLVDLPGYGYQLDFGYL